MEKIKITLKSDPAINDTILEYTGEITLEMAGRILEILLQRK